MGYRFDEFAPGEVFHVCTRGVESRDIFRHNEDRDRFRRLMLHCLSKDKVQSFSIALKFNQEFKRVAEGDGEELICHTGLIGSLLNREEYKEFVKDDADYARSIVDVQHLLIDNDV